MTSSVKGHDRACGIVGVWREPRRVVVDTDQCSLCQNRKPYMPDERLLVISMSLDPTDDSSSSLVGHRLALAFLVCVLFFLLFHDIVTQFHSFLEGLEFSFVLVRSRPFGSLVCLGTLLLGCFWLLVLPLLQPLLVLMGQLAFLSFKMIATRP